MVVIVHIGHVWSAYGKIAHDMGPAKYPNIFKYPRMEQTKILKYLTVKKFNKHISEYIWIKEKPLKGPVRGLVTWHF